MFPVLSQAKLKEGIFVEPQINKLLKDKGFDHTLSGIQKVAWNAFRDVAHKFFGNTKAPNYIELVDTHDRFLQKYVVQHVFKNTLLTFALGFFSFKLW